MPGPPHRARSAPPAHARQAQCTRSRKPNRSFANHCTRLAFASLARCDATIQYHPLLVASECWMFSFGALGLRARLARNLPIGAFWMTTGSIAVMEIAAEA